VGHSSQLVHAISACSALSHYHVHGSHGICSAALSLPQHARSSYGKRYSRREGRRYPTVRQEQTGAWAGRCAHRPRQCHPLDQRIPRHWSRPTTNWYPKHARGVGDAAWRAVLPCRDHDHQAGQVGCLVSRTTRELRPQGEDMVLKYSVPCMATSPGRAQALHAVSMSMASMFVVAGAQSHGPTSVFASTLLHHHLLVCGCPGKLPVS
jgi:hypothetical protein